MASIAFFFLVHLVANQMTAVRLPLQAMLEHNAGFDSDPIESVDDEEQRVILRSIVDMTSFITTDKASRLLKKLRKDSPSQVRLLVPLSLFLADVVSQFMNPQTFLAAMRLLEMYRFRLIVRRFVYELFGECIISQEAFETYWDRK